ncbi:MAG: DNA-binding protein [Clostridia bacterium]|nr:DNA-binding protein [Clostridia bacterium]
MRKAFFITLTGFKHCYDRKPFEPGAIVRLVKEPENPYDAEAISAEMPYIGRVAYVANSPDTVARGTSSAGRIHGTFHREAFAQVLFTTHASVICMLLPPEPKRRASGDPERKSGTRSSPRTGFIRKDADGLYMEM